MVFYDKKKKVISTKIISCIAQDLGLGGIANITSSYTAIHLDARTSNIWKGNECVSNSTVTSDFYKYYGLTKNDVYKIQMPNAPIELQNEFASFVKQIDKSKYFVQRQLNDLEELLSQKTEKYFGDY